MQKKLLYRIAIVLFASSCNGDDLVNQVPTIDTSRTPSKLEVDHPRNNLVYERVKQTDTILTFSIEGLSAEGSEVQAHYVNDSLRNAIWYIYGETGQSKIKYIFFAKGIIKAEEHSYIYKRQLSDVHHEDDMTLIKSFHYILDTSGALLRKISEKDYVNVFSDFKRNVPFVLKR